MKKKSSVNDDLSDVTVITTASTHTATRSTSVASIYRQRREREKQNKPRRRYPVRRIWKSRGALLVLLWNLLVFSYQNTAFSVNLLRFFNLNEPWKYILANIFLQEVLPKIFYPVAGWIADAKVGRYKVIRGSMVLMWTGSALLLLLSLLKYAVVYSPDSDVASLNVRSDVMFKVTLPFAILLYVVNAVSNAGFHANIIPFGLDQMEDGSADEHSAFIYWYYWTRNVSFGTLVYLLIHSNSSYCSASFEFGPHTTLTNASKEPLFRLDLGLLVCECAFLAAALCLDFVYSNKWLNKDPKTHYPLRRIWKISKFVHKHNQLVGRRKPITFTYEAPPERWDFAKRLYGGPFDGEDVEDVRTFWRIISFILSIGLGGIVIIYQGYVFYGPFVKHMKLPAILSQCISEYAVSLLSTNFAILLIVPIYEFVIYPFFRRYMLRIMRRIGVGMVLALVGTVGVLLMDIFGHRSTNNGHCLLFKTDFKQHIFPLDFTPGYLIPLLFLVSLGEVLIYVSIYEFICAQSPYSMRGLLIGLFYAIKAVFLSLVGLLFGIIVAIFYHHSREAPYTLNSLSCGSWYLISIIGIGITGLIIYVTSAKCYKKRERGGYQVNEQTVLEGYYEPKDDET